jgi:hypothetical protein
MRVGRLRRMLVGRDVLYGRSGVVVVVVVVVG